MYGFTNRDRMERPSGSGGTGSGAGLVDVVERLRGFQDLVDGGLAVGIRRRRRLERIADRGEEPGVDLRDALLTALGCLHVVELPEREPGDGERRDEREGEEAADELLESPYRWTRFDARMTSGVGSTTAIGLLPKMRGERRDDGTGDGLGE